MTGLARALAVTLTGLEGHLVDVEAHAASGLPAFTLVGLPDAAVRESRERVRAALSTCGTSWGEKRLTVNLSPADLPKAGTGFDLALALAVLAARGDLPPEALGRLARTVFIGELGLDGSVRPVRGVLPSVLAAVGRGRGRVVVPAAAQAEARLVPGAQGRPSSTWPSSSWPTGGACPAAPARSWAACASAAPTDRRIALPDCSPAYRTWPTSSARRRPSTPWRWPPRAGTTCCW